MKEQGERLRIAREAAGYDKQKKFQELVKVAQGTYSNHENGTRNFSFRTAKKYAAALGVDAQWLLDGTGKGPDPKVRLPLSLRRPSGIKDRANQARTEAPELGKFLQQPYAADLAALWNGLRPEMQDLAFAILREIAAIGSRIPDDSADDVGHLSA